MAITERILVSLKRLFELDQKVNALGERVRGLAEDMRDLDRRLIRVETALELASDGRFRPRLLSSNDDPPDRS